jgi:hypothetical protein
MRCDTHRRVGGGSAYRCIGVSAPEPRTPNSEPGTRTANGERRTVNGERHADKVDRLGT